LDIPGSRTHQIILVTTLLDFEKYSPVAFGKLSYRRWATELTLRNLKTTLQMEHLSCRTPGNLEREIRLHFLDAASLVRSSAALNPIRV
jgi:putative transposase